jgi:periplasmic protein TonB
MGYQALLFCTDDKTVRVITQVLSDLEFGVELSSEPFAAVKRLTLQHFDAVVVDCDDEQNAALLFKSARNSGPNHSALAVALVQGQAGIAKAFRIGANLVLTKPINVEQSKGTLRVARGLLRKADAAKSGAPAAEASAPAAVDFDLPRPPIMPAPNPAAPPPLPAKQSVPVGPVASTSLEVEAEPAPDLGAAEAALLESMPTPAPAPAPRPTVTSSPKRYPWQSSGKPFPAVPSPQPATSLKAEVDGVKAEGYLPASAAPADMAVTEDNRPKPGSLSSSGAAAAPARAKAASGGFLNLQEPETAEPEPPPVEEATRGTVQSKATKIADGEESGLGWSTAREAKAPNQSGSKRSLIAALIVVAMAAGGYFAWPRLRPIVMNLPIAQKDLHAQAQPPSPAPATAVAPPATPESAQPPTSLDQSTAPSAQDQPQPTTPEVIQAQPDEKPDAGITVSNTQAPPPAAAAHTAAPAAPPVAKSQQPIIVKSESRKAKPAPQVAEEVAPPSVGGPSDSADKSIAKIVGTSAAPSKPVFRPVRISQGISQGLLVKVIQPIYPAAARRMRVEGPVQLEATIGKDGSISNVKVLNGNPMLTGAAMEAVRRWKYKPYYLNGSPIEVQTEITINFKLP